MERKRNVGESTLLARRTQIKHAGETHNFVLGDSILMDILRSPPGLRDESDWLAAVPSDLGIN
jgi:hypothetical protein